MDKYTLINLPILLVVYALLFYGEYLYLNHFYNTHSFAIYILNLFIFNFLAFGVITAHIGCVITNPGYVGDGYPQFDRDEVERAKDETPTGWSVCKKCCIYRPPRTHHCSKCKRCIFFMDHHCPWVNNCIGQFNIKYFILFLIYTTTIGIHNIVTCVYLINTDINLKDDPLRKKHIIAGLILSIAFGAFVGSMLINQIFGILYDETSVEHVIRRSEYKTLFGQYLNDLQKYYRSSKRSQLVKPDDKALKAFKEARKKSETFREMMLRSGDRIFGKVPIYLWIFPVCHIFIDSKEDVRKLMVAPLTTISGNDLKEL